MLMLALLCNTASVTSLLCQEPKFKHAKECVQLPEAEEPHLVWESSGVCLFLNFTALPRFI